MLCDKTQIYLYGKRGDSLAEDLGENEHLLRVRC